MNRTKATSDFFMHPKNLWATRPAAVLGTIVAMMAAPLATTGCVNEAGIQNPPATWTYKQNPELPTDGKTYRTTGPQARYGENGTEFQPTLGGTGGYQGTTREWLRGITAPRRVQAEAGTGSAPGAERPSSSFDLEQSQLKSSDAPSQPAASLLRPDPRDKSKPAGSPGAIAPGAVVGGQGTGAGTATTGTAGATGGGMTSGSGPAAGTAAGPGASPVIGTRSGTAGGGATGTGRP